MKERPILFSAPMVQAILNGSKTQTRRVIKPQPDYDWMNTGTLIDTCDIFLEFGKVFGSVHEKWQNYYQIWTQGGVIHHRKRWWIKHPDKFDEIYCPFGEPKDQLWVRETFGLIGDKDQHVLHYRATHWKDYKNMGWKPSIHMPRWASRIQLEITNIRVERLNDISYADAKFEGWSPLAEDGKNPNPLDPKTWFINLWESINGTGSWVTNPWVWVVEFKRLKP